MAIKVLKEVNRTAGTLAQVDTNSLPIPILSGLPVKFDIAGDGSGAKVVSPALGTDGTTATTFVGIALDTTVKPVDTKLFSTYDGFSYNNLISAHIGKGGLLRVFNDGRGPVFSANVINAAPNTLIYIAADGTYTITAGAAGTFGGTAIGSIETAPTSVDDALQFYTL